MKTILTFAFVAFLAVTTSAVATDVHPSYSQTVVNNCFNFLRVHRMGNGAALTWSVNTQDLTGFTIQRSYDGDFFEDAGQHPCNGAAQYKFTDKTVFPGTIHYRIKAYTMDGTEVYSPVETVRIVRRG